MIFVFFLQKSEQFKRNLLAIQIRGTILLVEQGCFYMMWVLYSNYWRFNKKKSTESFFTVSIYGEFNLKKYQSLNDYWSSCIRCNIHDEAFQMHLPDLLPRITERRSFNIYWIVFEMRNKLANGAKTKTGKKRPKYEFHRWLNWSVFSGIDYPITVKS